MKAHDPTLTTKTNTSRGWGTHTFNERGFEQAVGLNGAFFVWAGFGLAGLAASY
jgi:hypothetical protein